MVKILCVLLCFHLFNLCSDLLGSRWELAFISDDLVFSLYRWSFYKWIASLGSLCWIQPVLKLAIGLPRKSRREFLKFEFRFFVFVWLRLHLITFAATNDYLWLSFNVNRLIRFYCRRSMLYDLACITRSNLSVKV